MDCTNISYGIVFKNHSYLLYEDRIKTFYSWPAQTQPDKYVLAAAGFLYTGHSDEVTCFACGVSLSEWCKRDIVQAEHLKWSPSCIYSRMIGSEQPLSRNSEQRSNIVVTFKQIWDSCTETGILISSCN